MIVYFLNNYINQIYSKVFFLIKILKKYMFLIRRLLISSVMPELKIKLSISALLICPKCILKSRLLPYGGWIMITYMEL